jgi:hypothetical protein
MLQGLPFALPPLGQPSKQIASEGIELGTKLSGQVL